MMKLLAAALGAISLFACAPDGGTNDVANLMAEDGAASTPATANLRDVKKGRGPALWLVSDDDTDVYLFGTVHVLPPDLEWRTPEIDAAFDAADTVFFEADVLSGGPEMAFLVNKLGMFGPDESLLDLLSEQDEADLVAAAQRLNMPLASLIRAKPWLAAISMSMQQIISEGHDPESGVESILLPEARENGKVLRFFETVEEQLRFMAELPMDVQVEFLMEGVRQIQDVPDFIDYLDEAWVNGDVEALGSLLLEDQSMTAPELYEAMLSGRNRRWTGELSTLMYEEEGVFFVAVGAAHLAGEDSVVTMLQQNGFTAERVQ